MRTNSTACAMVYFMHHVTRLFDSNILRSLSNCIDFSKVFELVFHDILKANLTALQHPKFLFYWINFLTSWHKICKPNGEYSVPRTISRSIVQRSGIKPTSHIVKRGD